MSAPTLTDLMNVLTADMGPGLLKGWAAISKYTGKSPGQLRRYVRVAGFPAYRWGRNTYSDRQAISRWLVEYARLRRERRSLQKLATKP